MLQPYHIQIQKWVDSTTNIASEIEMFAIESVLRMNTRREFESNLVNLYSFTAYGKVKG